MKQVDRLAFEVPYCEKRQDCAGKRPGMPMEPLTMRQLHRLHQILALVLERDGEVLRQCDGDVVSLRWELERTFRKRTAPGASQAEIVVQDPRRVPTPVRGFVVLFGQEL